MYPGHPHPTRSALKQSDDDWPKGEWKWGRILTALLILAVVIGFFLS